MRASGTEVPVGLFGEVMKVTLGWWRATCSAAVLRP